MHRFDVRVRYADTDQMGWAYYGQYLRWFEIGRAEMMRTLGRSYAQVEREDGVLLPVLDARCRYFHGARYDERITIETGVLEQGRATIRFGYTEHCVVTPDARPVRPPEALAALLTRAPRADEELLAEFSRRA